MQTDIHPQYNRINVECSCGNKFSVRSTLNEDLHLEICALCHPFYTGKKKLLDTAGRVDRFNQKYAKHKKVDKSDKTEKSNP